MKTRKHIGLFLLTGTCLLLVAQPAWAREPMRATAPDYTKGEQPATKKTKWAIGPTGAHGFFYYNDARQVLIDTFNGIDKGSPADGNLREGDVILGVLSPTTGQDTGNGKFTFDARRSMAIAIEEAEKKEHGGKLVLNVWRPNGKIVTEMIRPPGEPDNIRVNGKLVKNRKPLSTFHPDEPLSGKIMPVTLVLPVMGSYSASSPWECEKNEALINTLTKNIVKNGFSSGMVGTFDAMGLLATGDKAHLPRLQNYARQLAAKTAKYDIYDEGEKDGAGVRTWYAAYENLFLCEYYLITKDEQVLPGIKGVSLFLAQGVSGVGTWSHYVANVKGNGLYGPANGYGALNQISLVCAMTLVLAQKCGIEDPYVDKAVRLALNFNRYYVDKGGIPYGDHKPIDAYDNNGRMSIAAVLYDLAGDKKAAEYFTRRTLASYQTREIGHTGHYFSWQWGGLGAARGGPEAVASFMKNTRYFLELERRYDGRCVYQPQLPDRGTQTHGFVTTGQRLIMYCLPRKTLYITGKGASCVTPITGKELEGIVYAPLFNPKGLSTPKLLKLLGDWAIPVRSAAAQELGKRDDNVVKELIAMLDSPNRYARYGACAGLRYAGRGSTEAVDALVKRIETDTDMALRYFAVEALARPGFGKYGEAGKNAAPNGLWPASLRATDALLKLVTVVDPVHDPRQTLARQIGPVLSSGDGKEPGFYPSGKGAEKLDKDLLIPALKALLGNPHSDGRNSAAAILTQLPKDYLDEMWGEIYQATTTPAPSGVMFDHSGHINCIRVMAKHNIKEGVDYAAWYVLYKDDLQSNDRKKNGLNVLNEYGRALEPYFEEMKDIITKNRHIKHKGPRLKKIEEMRTEPVPEMVSIKEHIKTKPEKQFLDWWEERQKKKNDVPGTPPK